MTKAPRSRRPSPPATRAPEPAPGYGRNQRVDHKGCTACRDRALCRSEFECGTCGNTYWTCTHRPIDNHHEPAECTHCRDEREIGWRHPLRLPLFKKRAPVAVTA